MDFLFKFAGNAKWRTQNHHKYLERMGFRRKKGNLILFAGGCSVPPTAA